VALSELEFLLGIKMKNLTKIISIAIFLSASILPVSSGGQKAEWKGKIELEMPRNSLQKGIILHFNCI